MKRSRFCELARRAERAVHLVCRYLQKFFHPGLLCDIEQNACPSDVRFDEDGRSRDTPIDMRLCGKIDDHLDAELPDETLNRSAVADVPLDKFVILPPLKTIKVLGIPGIRQ